MTARVVIVGAGHGAGQVVATLKQKQFDGEIVLIGDEPWLPYQRPPLSKKYLAGELPAERLYFKPASFYEAPNITLKLGTRAEAIDPQQRQVLAGGERIGYDKLVIATGSRVRRLDIPGADLGGVHYLRDIADVDRIRADMTDCSKIAIVGAGYIGLEVAAVVRQLGHDVTVLEMAERVMSRVVSPAVSAFFEREHKAHGVALRLATGISAFEGDDGRVTGVTTARGDTIAADIVVAGIGIQPNAEIAAEAGLETDNGIVVDDHCRSNDPDIYAIGDCTSHPSAVYGRRIRLESVHNALEQAKVAASNICGEDTAYDQVPWFWSDQYDIKLQTVGLFNDYDDIGIRGDVDAAKFSALYFKDDRLIALDAVNDPISFMAGKQIFKRGIRVNKADAMAATTLKDLIAGVAKKEAVS